MTKLSATCSMVLGALLLFTGAACSTSTDENSASCDSSKCPSGYTCADNKCMLPCTRHIDCGNGFECGSVTGQTQLFCKPSSLNLFGEGQFGTNCGAKGDQDCDSGSNFVCSSNEADPDAYCTLDGCESDAECPGNYWCVGVNQTGGKVAKRCMKRDFCAPTSGLLQCDATDAALMKETVGGATKLFCSKKCSSLTGCGSGNYCSGGKCLPRSGSCIPPKEFCGRCWSNNDCPTNGYCIFVAQGAERFCIEKCNASQGCDVGSPYIYDYPAACDTDPKSPDKGLCLPDSATAESRLTCWHPCDNEATCGPPTP